MAYKSKNDRKNDIKQQPQPDCLVSSCIFVQNSRKTIQIQRTSINSQIIHYTYIVNCETGLQMQLNVVPILYMVRYNMVRLR